jgi:hypothetical protein
MATPEHRVKADIKKYLASIGAYWFMPVQSGYGAATLDMLVCHEGRFFGIEVKKPDPRNPIPKVTPRQEMVMEKIRLAGGVAFAASSVEHVKAMLVH